MRCGHEIGHQDFVCVEFIRYPLLDSTTFNHSQTIHINSIQLPSIIHGLYI